jgi:hypothetical protein
MSEVETECAISLRNRRDPHTAEGNACRCLVTRPPMQRKPCWVDTDKIDMIDTVLRGWTCPPIYVIPRLDLITRCSEGEDHVFDGAHKLEAVFDFIDDKFVFRVAAGGRFAELSGKRFSEMSREIQDRIKKYRFHINQVDAETAGSPDELRVLWERVNKAGKKLNKFELDLPLITPLIEHVLKPAGDVFRGTTFFPKEESHRGDLEQRLQVLLALSDLSELKSMSSQNNLVARWHVEKLGATMAARTETIETQGEKWRGVLLRCHKMLVELEQLNVFCDEEGVATVQEAHIKTELPFVLGRFAHRIPRIEDFRSKKVAIAARLKKDVFGKTIQELSLSMGSTGRRDGTFQKRLLKYIDDIACEMAGLVEPRLFTKAQKEEKLKEQGGSCPACGKRILKHHLTEGDHIVEWSEGGETTLANLQLLHKGCHQAKTASASSSSSASL